MCRELAVITTEYLANFVEDYMDRVGLDLDYKMYIYQSFEELPLVYDQIPEYIGGVITSGSFPAHIIRKSYPDTKRIIRAFDNDDAGIYRLILKLLHAKPGLDTARIFADILHASGVQTEEYLYGAEDIIIADKLDKITSAMSLNSLKSAEQHYCEKHLRLWKEKKIDVSVTRFSSIVTQLKNQGADVYFAYPSLSYVRSVCQDICSCLSIQELKANQPAAIVVSVLAAEQLKEAEKKDRIEKLLRVLQRYKKEHQMDAVIQKQGNGLEVITSRTVVEEQTDGFSGCRLQKYLGEYLDFSTVIGYGIGNHMYQARINAVDANRQANLKKTAESCLINEQDELLSVFRDEPGIVFSRNISDAVKTAAKQCGISALTLQRILTAAGTQKNSRLTSQELAYKMNITKRSANRFLSAMQTAGMAEVIELRKGTTMGRPERVYQISIERITK